MILFPSLASKFGTRRQKIQSGKRIKHKEHGDFTNCLGGQDEANGS